jgi:hypothetical protein
MYRYGAEEKKRELWETFPDMRWYFKLKEATWIPEF